MDMRSIEVSLVEKFDTVKVNDRDKRSFLQIGLVEVSLIQISLIEIGLEEKFGRVKLN